MEAARLATHLSRKASSREKENAANHREGPHALVHVYYSPVRSRTMKRFLYVFLIVVFSLVLNCSEDENTGSFEAGVLPEADGAAGSDAGSFLQCESSEAEILINCVQQNRYVADLWFIAQERPPGSEHWQAVQDLCAEWFEEFGYQVERQTYATGVNVIGVKPGNDLVDEQVVVSAHYDHLAGCPGADDNATGVAGVLEVARVLSLGVFARTLVVACWDEEERGLIGSRNYVQRASEQQEIIRVGYVFDSIGYKSDQPDSQRVPVGLDVLFPDQLAELEANEYRGDFVTLIHDADSDAYAESMVQIADQIGLPVAKLGLAPELITSGLVFDLLRSDHRSFWEAQYPAIMITDTAEFRDPNYHCRDGIDHISNLDHGFSVQIIQATIGSVAAALEF